MCKRKVSASRLSFEIYVARLPEDFRTLELFGSYKQCKKSIMNVTKFHRAKWPKCYLHPLDYLSGPL